MRVRVLIIAAVLTLVIAAIRPVVVDAAAGTMSVDLSDCDVTLSVTPTEPGEFGVVLWNPADNRRLIDTQWTDTNLEPRTFNATLPDDEDWEAILWDFDTAGWRRLHEEVISCDADTPTETPTDVPTETPTDVPTETPTDVPTETPTDVPTETPTDVPTETPTDVPTETPTDVPTETPTDVPTETPTDVPTETPTDVPTETPTDVPTETPTDVPTETPTDVPTETPTDVPTETPEGPAGGPVQGSGDDESDDDSDRSQAGPPFRPGDNRINVQAGAPAAIYCEDGNSRLTVYLIDPSSGRGSLAAVVPYSSFAANDTGGNVILANEGSVMVFQTADNLWVVRVGQADGKTYQFAFGGCPFQGQSQWSEVS